MSANDSCKKLADRLLEALDTESKADKWVEYLIHEVYKRFGPEAVERLEQKSPVELEPYVNTVTTHKYGNNYNAEESPAIRE